mmetsp:Transcript_30821/g.65535  ORF Transcript_30821/g.65535 Transcript_30821/m.65535 type:complete len:96 (-) Transcript_30821:296-583(-)
MAENSLKKTAPVSIWPKVETAKYSGTNLAASVFINPRFMQNMPVDPSNAKFAARITMRRTGADALGAPSAKDHNTEERLLLLSMAKELQAVAKVT